MSPNAMVSSTVSSVSISDRERERERERERDHHPQEEEEFSRLSESTNKTKRKKCDFFQRLDWDCLLTRIVFIVGCEKI
jgi:hypothetical protein